MEIFRATMYYLKEQTLENMLPSLMTASGYSAGFFLTVKLFDKFAALNFPPPCKCS